MYFQSTIRCTTLRDLRQQRKSCHRMRESSTSTRSSPSNTAPIKSGNLHTPLHPPIPSRPPPPPNAHVHQMHSPAKWMPPYLRLCDVTQPKLNMQNQIIKGFQECFAINFYRCLILVTSNDFLQRKPNLWEEQPLKMIFEFCKTSLYMYRQLSLSQSPGDRQNTSRYQ